MLILTKKDEGLAENTGTGGALVTAAAIIQHLMIMEANLISVLMVLFYIYALICFILLARKVPAAPVMLIISAVLVFLLEILKLISYALTGDYIFSPLLLILVLYHTAALTIIYADGLPEKLRRNRDQKLKEEAEWNYKQYNY